jgi:anti-sigma factor RsiW
LSHADVGELLGAYALDAVDADEREAVEHHLQGCPRCRAEVADHRTVASFLGSAGGPAPEGLWDRIAGALDEPAPELRLAPVVPFPGRRSVSLRVGGAAAAVAASVIAVLGVQVVHLNHQVDHLAAPQRPEADVVALATHALGDPAARRISLRASDGPASAEAVVLPDGSGVLIADQLPALASDRTYQLWALAGGQKISAGVLGARPQIVAFHYLAPGLSGLAVTAEQAGGVVETTNAPVVVGTLS